MYRFSNILLNLNRLFVLFLLGTILNCDGLFNVANQALKPSSSIATSLYASCLLNKEEACAEYNTDTNYLNSVLRASCLNSANNQLVETSCNQEVYSYKCQKQVIDHIERTLYTQDKDNCTSFVLEHSLDAMIPFYRLSEEPIIPTKEFNIEVNKPKSGILIDEMYENIASVALEANVPYKFILSAPLNASFQIGIYDIDNLNTSLQEGVSYGDKQEILFRPNIKATYKIKITRFTGSGNYTLTALSPKFLNLGDNILQKQLNAGSKDWYKIFVPLNKSMLVHTNIDYEIYTLTHTPVAITNNILPGYSTSKEYYIAILNRQSTAQTYNLTINNADTLFNYATEVRVDTKILNIPLNSDIWYKTSLRASNIYEIDTTALNYNIYNSVLEPVTVNQSNFFTISNDAGGTYYIKFTPTSYNNNENIEFMIRNITAIQNLSIANQLKINVSPTNFTLNSQIIERWFTVDLELDKVYLFKQTGIGLKYTLYDSSFVKQTTNNSFFHTRNVSGRYYVKCITTESSVSEYTLAVQYPDLINTEIPLIGTLNQGDVFWAKINLSNDAYYFLRAGSCQVKFIESNTTTEFPFIPNTFNKEINGSYVYIEPSSSLDVNCIYDIRFVSIPVSHSGVELRENISNIGYNWYKFVASSNTPVQITVSSNVSFQIYDELQVARTLNNSWYIPVNLNAQINTVNYYIKISGPQYTSYTIKVQDAFSLDLDTSFTLDALPSGTVKWYQYTVPQNTWYWIDTTLSVSKYTVYDSNTTTVLSNAPYKNITNQRVKHYIKVVGDHANINFQIKEYPFLPDGLAGIKTTVTDYNRIHKFLFFNNSTYTIKTDIRYSIYTANNTKLIEHLNLNNRNIITTNNGGIYYLVLENANNGDSLNISINDTALSSNSSNLIPGTIGTEYPVDIQSESEIKYKYNLTANTPYYIAQSNSALRIEIFNQAFEKVFIVDDMFTVPQNNVYYVVISGTIGNYRFSLNNFRQININLGSNVISNINTIGTFEWLTLIPSTGVNEYSDPKFVTAGVDYSAYNTITSSSISKDSIYITSIAIKVYKPNGTYSGTVTGSNKINLVPGTRTSSGVSKNYRFRSFRTSAITIDCNQSYSLTDLDGNSLLSQRFDTKYFQVSHTTDYLFTTSCGLLINYITQLSGDNRFIDATYGHLQPSTIKFTANHNEWYDVSYVKAYIDIIDQKTPTFSRWQYTNYLKTCQKGLTNVQNNYNCNTSKYTSNTEYYPHTEKVIYRYENGTEQNSNDNKHKSLWSINFATVALRYIKYQCASGHSTCTGVYGVVWNYSNDVTHISKWDGTCYRPALCD